MQYLKKENQFRTLNGVDIRKKLPIGIYNYGEDKFGAVLTAVPNFTFPDKVYHNDSDFISHVLKTWNNSDKSIGILLEGKKGLGKSFTAKVLCKNLNLPVIVINNILPDTNFLFPFLNEIEEPHVVFIDEFEKLFRDKIEDDKDERPNQSSFLSYFDGANTSNIKKMFIITSNKSIDDHFINRPSRLRYCRKYEKLHSDVIKEIVNDKLKNKKYKEDLISNVNAYDVNIDILIQIIEEINLHNTPYSSFMDFFNYTQESCDYEVFIANPFDKTDTLDIGAIPSTYVNAMLDSLSYSWRFYDDYINLNNKEYYLSIERVKGKPIKRLKFGFEVPINIKIKDVKGKTTKTISDKKAELRIEITRMVF